jgi:PhnB protein
VTAYEALRAPARGTPPDRPFVERLRAELTAALARDVALPDRSPTVTETGRETQPTSATTTTIAEASPGGALVPYLAVRGAVAAIDWYRNVFGAREVVRYTADDGTIGHAELLIGRAHLMLSDEYLEYGAASPAHLGGSSVALNLDVPDVDAVFERAVAAGAVVARAPADQPYGERTGQFLDPWGHRWMVQTTIATPSVDEINAAMDGFTVTVTDGGDDEQG